MTLAWHCGIVRWDLLAKSIPEPVLNGWVEWIETNALTPAQRDQFIANMATGVMNSNGFEAKSEDLMRLRMLKPWSPTDDEE